MEHGPHLAVALRSGRHGACHGVSLVYQDAAALPKEHDAGAHDQGLLDVVGDEDEGALGLLRNLQQLLLQLVARHGVERGEGLVHEDDLGFEVQGLGDGYALLHAARELAGVVAAAALQAHLGQGLIAQRLELGLVLDALELEAGLDVALDRFPREELVEVLEDHHAVDAGLARGLAVDQDLARVVLKAGHAAQQGGLAAAAGSQDAEELALRHLQAHVGEDGLARVGVLIDLAQAADAQDAVLLLGAHQLLIPHFTTVFLSMGERMPYCTIRPMMMITMSVAYISAL